MEKTKLEELKEMKLRTSKNKLHQTDARVYKQKLHDLFLEKFSEMGLDITVIENALIIEVPHEEFGAIPIEAKFIIKSVDYDVVSAGEQFQQKEQAKIDKEEERKAQAK